MTATTVPERIARFLRESALVEGGVRSTSVTHRGSRSFVRWLEVRSFGVTAEHLSLFDGLRAALVTAVPLTIMLATGDKRIGWAVFAAFWTCLVDGGGPPSSRAETLVGFAALGTATAFAASWIAAFGQVGALIAGPLVVATTALVPVRRPAGRSLPVLLGVVAVVAAGYPRTSGEAALLASAFVGGATWACLVLLSWRDDPWAGVRRAAQASFARLADMVADLASPGETSHPDGEWRPGHGQHRRAVRTAIERLRVHLEAFKEQQDETTQRFRSSLNATEVVFDACIALDHLVMTGEGEAEHRLGASQALLSVLTAMRLSVDQRRWNDEVIARHAASLREAATVNEVASGILSRAAEGIQGMLSQSVVCDEDPSVASGRRTPRVSGAIRDALRGAVSVGVVTLFARLLSLGYPYWATMAVVVVLQPGIRSTWARCVERVLGTMAGGLAVATLLSFEVGPHLLAPIAVVLSGVAIAMRSVSYALFVTALTPLFVIVVELLQAGSAASTTRIVDNLIGSLAALTAVTFVWPSSGKPLVALIADALAANRAYVEAVLTRDEDTVERRRREAGLASVEAELALHAFAGLARHRRQLSSKDLGSLVLSRRLAGEAAVMRHRSPGAGER